MYHDAGYPDEAVRYGELAARYERSAEAAPSTAALPTAAVSTAASPAILRPRPFPRTPFRPSPPQLRLRLHPAGGSPRGPEYDSAAVAVSGICHPGNGPCTRHSETHDPASDISSEWEQSLSVDDPAAPGRNIPKCSGTRRLGPLDEDNPEIAETVEEIRFYLEHFMTDQARARSSKSSNP